MPKRLPKDVEEKVLVELGNSPDGLRIKELSRLLGDLISRRSLQRRLSELVAAGKLTSEKGGRSTRYFVAPRAEERTREAGSIQLAAVVGDALPEWKDDVQMERSIPVSPSGAEVRRAVRKPKTERTPIGYNREFLDDYRPNESRYLTPETLAHLARIGRTPESDTPAGTYARHILDRLLIDLSCVSSRLKGNTYSLLDTKELIEHGQAAEGKDAAETQMILNHKAAIEFVVESAGELAFNKQMILNLHALLSDNLLPDPGASGRLRKKPVGIAHSVYSPSRYRS